jgi:hypothetical protein
VNYNQKALEDLKRDYDAGSVRIQLELADQDIRAIISYAAAAKAQLEVIKNTKFRKVVYLGREHFTTRVEFYVGLRLIPDIPGGDRTHYPVLHSRRFKGNERKQAFEYADQLVKEHDAVLEKIGF